MLFEEEFIGELVAFVVELRKDCGVGDGGSCEGKLIDCKLSSKIKG